MASKRSKIKKVTEGRLRSSMDEDGDYFNNILSYNVMYEDESSPEYDVTSDSLSGSYDFEEEEEYISSVDISYSLDQMVYIMTSQESLVRSEGDLHETSSSEASDESGKFKLYSELKVVDGLAGLTMLNPGIGMFVPEKIVVRTDHSTMNDKVKLLSGGCSGRDPLFTGYIGYGMLTAAVYGDEKGGPTAKQILLALRELNTPRGIIIIIKNNMDERLNFGLAMERARAEGIIVDMVAVGDDCWETQENSVGRRCLAGLIAVIKVAGAMSEAKKSMRDIYIMCRAMIISSLSSVFLRDSSIRFGTDINGNGGCNEGKMDVHALIINMVKYMIDAKRYFSLSVFPLNKFIVLVNSYNIDGLLLGYVAKELLHQLQKVNVCVERMFCSTFISGPRPGFCITLIKDIGEELIRWIDNAIPTKYWPENALLQPVIRSISLESSHSLEVECEKPYIKGPRSSTMFYDYCLECVSIACRAIISSEFMLNSMDPMGHYGSLLANGAKELLKVVEDNQLNRCKPYFFITKIGNVLEESIVGATGTMYGLFFAGIAQHFLNYTEIVEVDIDLWAAAIKKGINTLAAMTNIRLDECTLIDALIPLYRGLVYKPSNKFLERIKEGVEGAESGAQATAYMKSSKHIPDLPEPGAQTVAIIARAIYETVKRLYETEEKMLRDPTRVVCPIGIVELAPSEEPLLPLAEAEREEVIVLGEEGEAEYYGDLYGFESDEISEEEEEEEKLEEIEVEKEEGEEKVEEEAEDEIHEEAVIAEEKEEEAIAEVKEEEVIAEVKEEEEGNQEEGDVAVAPTDEEVVDSDAREVEEGEDMNVDE